MESRNRRCRTLGRVVLISFLVSLNGCSNDASPDDPVVLGVPPDTAYLGVEYSYNFGAYGGADILDFSLANAPAWLAFEDTANKARTGVILRGVPGITGGRRGEEDLGNYDRISVNATDGRRLGGNYFDIEVEHNTLAMVDAALAEGQPYLPQAALEVLERAKAAGFDPEDDNTCLPPAVDEVGTYTASDVPVFTDTGLTDISDRAYQTHPVVVAVTLAQPSVERVSVAFEVGSAFSCEADTEAADCEYTVSNQDDAQPLVDFIANSGTLAEPPDYLQYTSENEGVLTFEAGKTTCFIRLEIMDDRLPELAEELRLDLVEVREGLASITERGAERRAELRIEDNEPSVSFTPSRLIITEIATEHAGSDPANNPQSRRITARLDKTNATGATVKVRVKRNADLSTASEADYVLVGDNGETGPVITVEIPNGAREASFTIQALNNAGGSEDNNTVENTVEQLDDILVLESDVTAQFGREDYARAGDAKTEVIINEWQDTLDFTSFGNFIPTALVTGLYGELYVAGLSTATDPGTDAIGDETGDFATVLLFNRFGEPDPGTAGIIYASSGNGTRVGSPKIDFADQTDTSGASPILTRSLAVGFTVFAGVLTGQDAVGGDDIGLSYLQWKSDSTDMNFESVWEAQLGSPAQDRLVDVRTNPNLGVVFGANTLGNWPLSGRQSYLGGQDGILGRVLTDTAMPGHYRFEWARMLGTSADDRLVASPISGGGTLFAAGETTGALEPDKTYGGTELFFIRTDAADLNFITQQYGTPQDDSVSDAAYIGSTVWTSGSNRVPYQVQSGGTVASDTAVNASRNPYVLVFSANEAAVGSITLVDENGDRAIENIHAIDGGNDYAVIGGDTDGSFQTGVQPIAGRDAILASVRFKPAVAEDDAANEEEGDEDEDQLAELMQEDWRYQLNLTSPTRVVDVALSGNGKVFALIESGSADSYSVILLDERGLRLDAN